MDAATETHPRTRILETALDLFAQHGFSGTSVRQIAAAVGLKPSSLYSHFAGKEAILSALIEAYGPANNAYRMTMPDYQGLSNLPAFCQRYTSDLLDQWCDPHERKFLRLLHAEPKKLQAHRAHFNEALFQREVAAVASHFRRLTEAGQMHCNDAEETARLFMGGLTFIRMEHVFWAGKPSDRAVIANALDRAVANFLALTAPMG